MTYDERFKHIMEASLSLFSEYGIRSVSMDDICRHLGMSKKTLYQYVENKADLIKKINNYAQEQIFEKINQHSDSELNAIDILLEISKEMNVLFKNYNPRITFDIQKFYPEVYREHITYKRDRMLELVIHNIKQGIREGLYRDDFNVEVVAHLYINKVEDMHKPEFYPAEKYAFTTIFETMFENHIRGIANEAGIKYFEKQKEQLNFEN